MSESAGLAAESTVTRTWDQVNAGDELPVVTFKLTLALCVLDAAATRDFFPGHHDRDYARAQNARDAYLNTMFLQGFVDRVAGDWLGPLAWLARRRLEMAAPVCIGDTIRTEGKVTRKYEEAGRALVEIALSVKTEHGLGARARLTYALPRRAGESALP
jgi:acyl dehydratase